MGIKVTEMTEATQVNNSDWLMIVQNGENKKITKETLQDSIVDAELEERVDTLEDNVEDLQDEVEALQEENLYLNNLVEQAFDKKEVEGEELSIDDTVNAKMEVDLLGNTKQETTTGKQLFDVNNQMSHQFITNGDEIIANKPYSLSNNIITISENLNSGRKFFNKISYKAGTYTLSGKIKFINSTTYKLWYSVRNFESATDIVNTFKNIGSSTGTFSITFTLSDDLSSVGISLQPNTPNDGTIEISDIQLEPGSTASSYEKYTGGIASPNPSYPSNVNVVTGDNTIVVSNKNLFDKNNANILNAYVDSTSINSNNNCRLLYIPILPNTTYTISKVASSRFRVATTSNVPANGVTTYNYTSNDNGTYTTITTNANAKYLCVFFYQTQYDTTLTYEQVINSIQIEKGSTATSYEEHQEQTLQINLGNIEFCGIGDYRDYLYKSNNKWYLHKQIGKVVLDGTENWYYDSPNKFTLLKDINMKAFNINTTGYLFCDYYTEIKNADIDNYDYAICRYGTSASYNYNKIIIKDKNCTSTTQLNNKLSTNNVSVYYILLTPAETEITDTTLISQLEALKTAMSYTQQTNISQINNDAPFILKITALASYNSRIVALEQAILNANRSTPVENTRKSNEVIEEPKEEVVDDNKDEPKEEIKEER